MQPYRPDRVVRVLTTIVSISYFGLFALAAVALVGMPALKLFAGDDPDWELGVPASVPDSESSVRTRWGTARLELEDVRANLKLPIGRMPWWFVGLVWTEVAVACALMLLSLHHLRRIFQRVRDGVPFDLHNALRLRWLGLLLLALALFNGVAEFCTSLAVRSGLTSSSITGPTGLHINVPVVLVALVLLALAEIFRRGAELEDEQSLVV